MLQRFTISLSVSSYKGVWTEVQQALLHFIQLPLHSATIYQLPLHKNCCFALGLGNITFQNCPRTTSCSPDSVFGFMPMDYCVYTESLLDWPQFLVKDSGKIVFPWLGVLVIETLQLMLLSKNLSVIAWASILSHVVRIPNLSDNETCILLSCLKHSATLLAVAEPFPSIALKVLH